MSVVLMVLYIRSMLEEQEAKSKGYALRCTAVASYENEKRGNS
jgi:hypothetical protein